MKPFSKRYKPLLTHPLFFLFMGILPCLAVTFHFLSAKSNQQDLKEDIRYLDRKNHQKKHIAKRERNVIERLKRADPDYVQKTLEQLTFLNGEMKRIEAVLLHQPEDRSLLKRFDFLKEGGNRLQFREKNFQRLGKLQEVDVIQEHPVEMGKEDLKLLLSKLEHASIGPYAPDSDSPDFLIKQFELIRKPLSKDDEVFLIKFHSIKREYIHEYTETT